jgi:hypothetical protein
MNRCKLALIACSIMLPAVAPRLACGVTYNVPPDAFPTTLNAGDILNISGSASLPGGFSAASGSQINLLAGATLDFLFTTATFTSLLEAVSQALLALQAAHWFLTAETWVAYRELVVERTPKSLTVRSEDSSVISRRSICAEAASMESFTKTRR